jgi:N-acetyl-gamma-glutamyl-phosphate reductase
VTTPPRVAILGASGYTGQELRRILTAHPGVDLAACMTARRDHVPPPPALPGDPVIEALDLDALREMQGVFLCTPHGAAAELTVASLDQGCKVVDLSADFRLRDADVYARTYGQPHAAPQLLDSAVYGLTEFHRDEIPNTTLVANPGCYPTSILLPLLPLLEHGLVAPDAPILADSKSGVSGAGKTPKDRTVFGAIAENFLAYGVGDHRHNPEIWQEAATDRIVFVPHLLPMFRGMLSTIYVTPAGADSDAADAMRGCLAERYQDEPFVRVFDRGQPETGRVARTNQCHIAVARAGSQVVLTSVIDNLGKGAAGQAVQNMNLMLGLPEAEGLE